MNQPSEEACLLLIGEKVRYYRRLRKLTQAKLAVACGFARTSIANLEAGRQSISLDGLYRISRGLAVNPASLMPTHNEVCEELQNWLEDAKRKREEREERA